MAFCVDSGWTIEFHKDPLDLRLPLIPIGSLFFDLRISGGVITGKVYLHGKELSDVTGTCREVEAKEIALIDLAFRWGADVVLTGVARREGIFTRFRGRYCGFDPTVKTISEEIKRLGLLAVDVGETGSGNGTQT